jgi:hypothetical protein
MQRSALIGIGLGITFFWVIFGFDLLCPQHTDWLLQPGNPDSAQHLVGWEFFRHEPWHFPLGQIQSYGFPVPTSVVYTDSIPLVAIFAKCFHAVLSKQFQYFGIWLMVCYGLQGFFAWHISRTIHAHVMIQILITCFFVLSPILLNRTIEHQALAAQWILLACILLYIKPFEPRSGYVWIALSLCALMIHAYLMIMTLALECGYIYKNIHETSNAYWRKWLLFLITQSLLLLCVAWIVGYFVIDSPRSWGLPGYSANAMNLLAPFIATNGAISLPNHWSFFLGTLKLPLLEQGDEGFNYLGLGFILLSMIALFCSKKIIPTIHWKRWMPLGCICVIFTFYAISNRVTWANHVLFTYPRLPLTPAITDVFRASGRFFWPVYYVLMFTIFMLLSKRFKNNLLLLFLGSALIIQILDLSTKFKELHHYFAIKSVSFPHLPKALVIDGGKKYRHLVFLPYTPMPQISIPYFQYYAQFAAQHQMTVNIGYFARLDNRALRNFNTERLQKLLRGQQEANTFYFITEPKLAQILNMRFNDVSYQLLSLNSRNR